MAQYTYLFCDLLTNTVLAELPLTAVTFENVINGAGTFAGTLGPLTDPNIKGLPWAAAAQEGRTAIYVDRDGTLMWGGILWTARYDSAKTALVLGGLEFASFYLTGNLDATKAYVNVEQCNIVRDLLTWDAARAGRNISMNVAATISPVLRTVTWNSFELKRIGDMIAQLQLLPDGIDYSTTVAWNGNVPTKTFNIGWPRLGQLAFTTGLIFDGGQGGNIVSYIWPRDAWTMADHIWATGAGQAAAMLRTDASDTSLLAGGWPLLEDVVAHKDIRDLAALAGYANADVARRNFPVVIPQLSVRPDLDPPLGSWRAGDDCRVRISDDYWGTPGLDSFYRIISTKITPGDDAPEQVLLTLGAP